MIKPNELTNKDLQMFKSEYDRLIVERKRIDLQIEAILTTSALKLEKVFNTNRLDYAHVANAYSAFSTGDMESMQFRIVDTTIRDLFLQDEKNFKFTTIIPYESGAYEFVYQYFTRTISIKIPAASYINKDNIDNLDWGVFTVYEITKRTDIATEKIEIIKSDDISLIKTKIMELLTPVLTTDDTEDIL